MHTESKKEFFFFYKNSLPLWNIFVEINFLNSSLARKHPEHLLDVAEAEVTFLIPN